MRCCLSRAPKKKSDWLDYSTTIYFYGEKIEVVAVHKGYWDAVFVNKVRKLFKREKAGTGQILRGRLVRAHQGSYSFLLRDAPHHANSLCARRNNNIMQLL